MSVYHSLNNLPNFPCLKYNYPYTSLVVSGKINKMKKIKKSQYK